MDQPVHVILSIDKVNTAPQMALDSGPGLDGLNQVYRSNQAHLGEEK